MTVSKCVSRIIIQAHQQCYCYLGQTKPLSLNLQFLFDSLFSSFHFPVETHYDWDVVRLENHNASLMTKSNSPAFPMEVVVLLSSQMALYLQLRVLDHFKLTKSTPLIGYQAWDSSLKWSKTRLDYIRSSIIYVTVYTRVTTKNFPNYIIEFIYAGIYFTSNTVVITKLIVRKKILRVNQYVNNIW